MPTPWSAPVATCLEGSPPRPGIWRRSGPRSGAALSRCSSRAPLRSNIHHNIKVLGPQRVAEEATERPQCLPSPLLHIPPPLILPTRSPSSDDRQNQVASKTRRTTERCRLHGLPRWPRASRAHHHGQEYGGGADRGAGLHSAAVRLGRRCVRTYTTTSRSSANSGLQRKQPCARNA